NHPPLEKKAVRQALNYALNRKHIVETILVPDADTSAALPWPSSSPAYDAQQNSAYQFNLDKAKSLLKEAGVSDVKLELSFAARPDFPLMAQFWQADLAQIGVDMKLNQLDTTAWLAAVATPVLQGGPPTYKGAAMDGGDTGAQSDPVWPV